MSMMKYFIFSWKFLKTFTIYVNKILNQPNFQDFDKKSSYKPSIQDKLIANSPTFIFSKTELSKEEPRNKHFNENDL